MMKSTIKNSDTRLRIIIGIAKGSGITKPMKTLTIELKGNPLITPEASDSDEQLNEANVDSLKELLKEAIGNKNIDYEMDYENETRVHEATEKARKEERANAKKLAPKLVII